MSNTSKLSIWAHLLRRCPQSRPTDSAPAQPSVANATVKSVDQHRAKRANKRKGGDARVVSLETLVLGPEWVDHFWRRVDRSGGPQACWPWRASLDHYGYGACSTPKTTTQDPKTVKAHRMAVWLDRREEPQGLEGVLHGDQCERSCCNPAHLRIGTRAENTHDAVRLGHIGHGHAHYSAISAEQLERVVLMISAGQPNATIVRHTGVSLGTVKNVRAGKHFSNRKAKSISRAS